MKRATRDALHRALRGAEGEIACVALGMADSRDIGDPDLQEMEDRLRAINLTIDKVRDTIASTRKGKGSS